MIESHVHIENRIAKIRQNAKPEKRLSRSAFLIRRVARAQFVRRRGRAKAGSPPHTRRGKLPRSILYYVDRQREEAVIGPAAHLAGKSGKPHEHGGKYRGARYDERPFMGPALEAMLDQIPGQFSGLIGP